MRACVETSPPTSRRRRARSKYRPFGVRVLDEAFAWIYAIGYLLSGALAELGGGLVDAGSTASMCSSISETCC